MDIAGLTESDSALEVTWRDGLRSRFRFEWLRDNCTCAECGTTVTGARFLRLTDIPTGIRPVQTSIDEHGRVTVCWSGDGHMSSYEARWLAEHCRERRIAATSRPKPWDVRIEQSLPQFDYPSFADYDTAFTDLVEQLFHTGFVLIRQVPVTEQAVVDFAVLLGEIRSQSYAQVFDIWQKDNPDILSNTQSALAPHVDEPFRSHPPGLFLLHCMLASPDGGGASVLVDGFKLGETLRKQSPDDFATLCEIPMPHHRHREGHFDHHAQSLVFSLDEDGEIIRFRFAERSAAPLVLAEALTKRVYAARRALLKLAYDPAYQFKITLSPGDALLIDNHRLMHGREAFVGSRHLRQTNLDRDEVFSRYRMSCRRVGRRPVV